MTSDAFTDVTQNDPPEWVNPNQTPHPASVPDHTRHVCDWGSAWPTGHPLPPEDPAKLTGPEVGALCIITSKYRTGLVVRVLHRSYVWSPGECRSKGGYRHYDWSVITDDHGYRVVMDDKDLLVVETGMTVTL